MPIDLDKMNFVVLEDLLALGDSFYEANEAAKTAAKLAKEAGLPSPMGKGRVMEGASHKKRRKGGLKESQPW